ncbi:MAG: pantetheine-phosphate adenylyltransferase [Patulibacter minatonensis]
MTPSPRIAVCPGTYDPITNGHLDIITRAASTFDEVVVAVVHRPHRKGTTLFDIEERLDFIREATSELPNVRVQTFRTLIVEFAREVGAQAIVKGLRAISDFEYELEMFQMNRHVAEEIDTFYLMASPRFSFLSSSGVKELAAFGGNVDGLVQPRVARRLQEELGGQRN